MESVTQNNYGGILNHLKIKHNIFLITHESEQKSQWKPHKQWRYDIIIRKGISLRKAGWSKKWVKSRKEEKVNRRGGLRDWPFLGVQSYANCVLSSLSQAEKGAKYVPNPSSRWSVISHTACSLVIISMSGGKPREARGWEQVHAPSHQNAPYKVYGCF